MKLRIGIGHSDDPASILAAPDILAQALAALDGEAPVAALLFCAIDHDHQAILAIVHEALGRIPLIGCTTDGEVSSVMSFQEDSVVLALFAGDLVATASSVERVHADVDGTVAQAMLPFLDKQGGLMIMLPDGLTLSGDAMVHAVARHLPPGITAIGATAGDQWRFRGTHQFHQNRVLDQGAVFLHLAGDFEVLVGIGSGWSPVGRPGRVTSAVGNRVHTIDDAPALDFYRSRFGSDTLPDPQFPICTQAPGGQMTLRAPMAFDTLTGDLVFAGDVSVGAQIWLNEGSRDAILSHGALSAERWADRNAAFLFMVSCAARKQVLGTRTCEEVAQLQNRCGPIPIAGFYGYGEFLIRNGEATFFNETLVTAALVPR